MGGSFRVPGASGARRWREVIAAAIPDQGPPDRQHRKLAMRILIALYDDGGLVVDRANLQEVLRMRRSWDQEQEAHVYRRLEDAGFQPQQAQALAIPVSVLAAQLAEYAGEEPAQVVDRLVGGALGEV